MNLQFELRADKGFEEAVSAIKEELKPFGFGVLWEMNFKDKLKEKGLDFATNYQVIEVCNPSKALRVLETDLGAGYFLPCKLVVYEEDNSVYIGMLSPKVLIEVYGNKDLNEIAQEVEEDLIAAITKAV